MCFAPTPIDLGPSCVLTTVRETSRKMPRRLTIFAVMQSLCIGWRSNLSDLSRGHTMMPVQTEPRLSSFTLATTSPAQATEVRCVVSSGIGRPSCVLGVSENRTASVKRDSAKTWRANRKMVPTAVNRVDPEDIISSGCAGRCTSMSV